VNKVRGCVQFDNFEIEIQGKMLYDLVKVNQQKTFFKSILKQYPVVFVKNSVTGPLLQSVQMRHSQYQRGKQYHFDLMCKQSAAEMFNNKIL
jgi:hypothetical protein